jgi:hypothetical protein
MHWSFFIADGIAQIKSGRACNATASELCEAMKKMLQIAGHNDNEKEDDDNDNDSMGLETIGRSQTQVKLYSQR